MIYANTEVAWLLIFDNVEDISVLDNYWPLSAKGSVLITSRHENVAFEVNAESLKISPFSMDDGSALLLKTLHRRSASVSDEERKSAEALSTVLGGLALAITVAGRQIQMKRMPIKNFVKSYIDTQSLPHSSKINSTIYYNHSLETVWKTAFSGLDSNSAYVFDAACFSAPDILPLSLFADPGLGVQSTHDAGSSFE